MIHLGLSCQIAQGKAEINAISYPSCLNGILHVFTEPKLPIGHYRLAFKARETWRLPPFAGDMWRRALKSATHALDLRDDRLGGSSTVVDYLFASVPGPWAQKMSRYDHVPHPLIVRPTVSGPQLLRSGDEIAVDIILVGHANTFLGALIQSANVAATKGLGLKQSRGRCALSAIHHIDLEQGDAKLLTAGVLMAGSPAPATPQMPTAKTDLTLHLTTPLRVKRDGSYVDVPHKLDARSLLMALVRRISMLSYFHTDQPLETDFAALKDLALRTEIKTSTLALEHLERPATAQRAPEPMDGLVGKLRLTFDQDNPFWPYLWLARWVGIGHGANIGLGMIELET